MSFALTTDRLLLREMTPDDLDFIADMLADPEVMRFYPKRHTREESLAWINRQRERYAGDGHGLWLAIERDSGLPIGQAGLLLQEVNAALESEIGYLLHRPYWRRGYATEAALGVRRYAFETLGKHRVVSLIRPENLPSLNVARRIGMTPESEVVFKGYRHILHSVTKKRAGGAGGP